MNDVTRKKFFINASESRVGIIELDVSQNPALTELETSKANDK